MRTYTKRYGAVILILFFTIACTSDFEDVNKNKNLPSSVSSADLLRSIIFDPINPNINMQLKLGGQVMQYLVYTNANSIDVYNFSGDATVLDAVWNANYKAIRNSRELQSIEGIDPSYVAASKIMEAYHLSVLTDMWKDVPNTEAGLGDANISPKYDAQEKVFTTILNNLKEANTTLSKASISFKTGGDVLFVGDVGKWRKMANSLRLKILLRVSNKYANAQTDFEEILKDATKYPVITNNADAAVYDITGVSPNISDFSNITNLSGITMSQRFVEKLYNGTRSNYTDDDPRLAFFTELRVESEDEKEPKKRSAAIGLGYLGATSGATESEAKTTETKDNSTRMKSIFQDKKGLWNFGYITYSEFEFILAEAALKGWTVSGTAQNHFEKAITANFDYWSITMPANFLTRNDVKLDGIGTSAENQLERLLDQKWISGFGVNMFSIWSDHKRTGLPKFTIGGQAQGISKTIPNRVLYPINEQSVNSSSYKAAVGGKESINTKMWYQN